MRLNDLIGQHLGRYEIQELLGQGGMAAVYRAYDTALQRPVALKILYPQYLNDAELIKRFRREAITAAQLDHPNIVPIYDVGDHDGQIYIAMKLLAGQPLQDLLGASSQLPLEQTLALARQIAEALDYAHSQGVIHRDIKPANIVIEPDGRAILTDFGIAKTLDEPGITTSGVIIGTPEYMAPEQIDTAIGPIEPVADVYSFGVLLYRMLTGRRLFDGTTTQVLLGHLHSEPPSLLADAPHLPAGLDAVLKQALAKAPAARYPSAGELIHALQAASTATHSIAAQNMPHTVRRAAPAPPARAFNSYTGAEAAAGGHGSALPPAPRSAATAATQGRAGLLLVVSLVVVMMLLASGGIWLALSGGQGRAIVGGLAGDTPQPSAPAGGASRGKEAALATAGNTATPTPWEERILTVTATPSAGPSTTPDSALEQATATSPPPSLAPAQPTEPPPSATPRPTATAEPPTALPSPTPCVAAMQHGFKRLWETNEQIRQDVGCPLAAEAGDTAVIQYYPNGALYWWGSTDTIYAMVGQAYGTWSVYSKSEMDGIAEAGPSYTCGEGEYKPVRGFGKLLASQPNLAQSLGRCGITPEEQGAGAYQPFEYGHMLFMPATGSMAEERIWVLVSDRSFTRHLDPYP